MPVRNGTSNQSPDGSGKKAFTKLAIDTSFARQNRRPPRQIFPLESKRQQPLTFIDFEEMKARRSAKKESTKHKLESSNDACSQDSCSGMHGVATNGHMPSSNLACEPASPGPVPLHKRIKGLRPAPLDLTQDISPSDRAIPIGIALSPSTISHISKSPQAPSPPAEMSMQISKQARNLPTPTIVVTPAREDFPDDLGISKPYRPTSSVYSRFTNYMPKQQSFDTTPPVPSLPRYLHASSTKETSAEIDRTSAITCFEEDSPSSRDPNEKISSTCIMFEDDASPLIDPQQNFKRTASGLPTPRRSKGWWNLITSPFSAKSANKQFWRSPTMIEASPDEMPILQAASEMGTTASHGGVIFTTRADDDNELRSAPLCNAESPATSQKSVIPKRSDTAPGALDRDSGRINIYRIPSQGLARAYYDKEKHFPSVCLAPSENLESGETIVDDWHSRALEDIPEGWSPSHSVAVPKTPSPKIGLAAEYYDTSKRFSSPRSGTASLLAAIDAPSAKQVENHQRSPERGFTAADDDHSIIDIETDNETDDGEEILPRHVLASGPERPTPARAVTTEPTPQVPLADAAVFSTPCEDELKSGQSAKPQTVRSATQETAVSYFSPMSATPVVEDAHMATYAGPHSTFGEQREVDVSQGRPFTPQTLAMDDGTYANVQRAPPALPPTPIMRPSHMRQDSQGLGIFNERTGPLLAPQSSSEKNERSMFAATEYPGQELEGQRPSVPWYRRFVFLIGLIAACLLIMMIVLLVVFVPRSRPDAPIQASWLNTTGFPPMPTGMSTVIQPENTVTQNTCVSQSAVWSCSPPSDAQSNLPNFRIQVSFKNGTVPNNDTMLATNGRTLENEIQNMDGEARDAKRSAKNDNAFSPSPPPPSQNDQIFLGQTTDNVSFPFDGESTPFFIALLNATTLPTASPASLQKRASNFSYPYPDSQTPNASTISTSKLPSPDVQSHGQPADQKLYPFVSAQPVKLFNRGQDSEHYGFYTYFDRSVYMAGLSSNTTQNDDVSSDVSLSNATAVCTWSQTRLHVQIWTRKKLVTALPSAGVSTVAVPAGNSTANNMVAPGSFPYAVTISLDRHGGAADDKGVYCYGIKEGLVDRKDKWWIDEARGDALINPAEVPGSSNATAVHSRDASAGQGIDGGMGGCSCQWATGG